MDARRSGHAVKGTALTSGLTAAILAPWVSFELRRIEYTTGIVLPEGYDATVLVAITTALAFVASEVRMRSIEGRWPFSQGAVE